MAKGSTHAVTIELSDLELALLYHTVLQDRGERRQVLWQEVNAPRPERHFVALHWLESKVFGRIAEAYPELVAAMEEAQRRLSLRS